MRNSITGLLQSFISPLKKFIQIESAGGILLMGATLIALVWANSSSSSSYFSLLRYPIGTHFGRYMVIDSLQHWVNDGLMVLFFFVIGLEIKKEFIVGELADRKRAAFPIIAAIGGMLVPAFIYAIFKFRQPTASGWGIPMATDIAFAIGVLALLGKRVPLALTVFLLALAIVDDLGAILIIAFFYTSKLSWIAMVLAALGFTAIKFLNNYGVHRKIVYVILGILIWCAVLQSGVHATVAGVILGLLTPIYPLVNKDSLRSIGFDLLRKADEEHISELQTVAGNSISPADFWIQHLHPWVTFLIMPLFAFCNAGVRFENLQFHDFIIAPVSLGVFFGLVCGKPLGIFLFAWISCHFGWAQKPSGIEWRQILGVAALAGIGFTMALFIGQLSLGDQQPFADFAKLAILLASLASAFIGSVILVVARPNQR